MTDIEKQITEVLRASVADAMPGFDVVAAVRSRRRHHLIRAATASAAAVAALGTAAAVLVVRGESAPTVLTVASAVASVPCKATTAMQTEPIPAAFIPVAVVRCYSPARGVPGHGLWRFKVKQWADHRLAAFIAALRRPSVSIPTPGGLGPCNGRIPYFDPPFALVDHYGQIVRPILPTGECHRQFPAAIADLKHLPWVDVYARRTVQLATRAELRAGCDPRWKDVLRDVGHLRDEGYLQSPGGPAFSARPPQLRICVYQSGSDTFIRGGIISQAAESKLLGDIQGGGPPVRCRRSYTEFAVLLAVSPANYGSAEAELGGCDRILRPGGRLGRISPAGLSIIRAVGRPTS
jgi:hypothetical protein